MADTYLEARGLSIETATQARLGVVDSPEPGHEHYAGRLVIPYLDMVGVYALKFRCMSDHNCKETGCSKYLAPSGQEVSIFGVVDCDAVAEVIHIAEGELDRLILRQVFDEPAVGVPGVQTWQPHWHMHFSGFERVLIWPDGDKAGLDLANKIRHVVRNAEVVQVPKGVDVTELFLSGGADVMRAMVGEEEEVD